MAHFIKEEFLQRLAITKKRMDAAAIDLLILECPENILYLTGYDGWSYYTHQALLVHVDARDPVLILRQMDVAGAEMTCYMPSDQIIGYPEAYVGTAERHPMQFIAAQVRSKGWEKGRIGVEMDAHFFTAKAFSVLQAELPNARFSDAYLLVNWVRTYKSSHEIAIMRQAGQIAQRAMRTAIDAISVGVRECDVAGMIFNAQISGTPEFGGSVPSDVAIPAGRRSDAAHLSWTDNRYVNDMAVNIELGGARHNYHSGLARTVYLGHAPQGLLDLCSITNEGLMTALEAVRPGQTCEAVEAAWRQAIGRHGFAKKSRIGYAIGLCFVPAWIELTASLQQGDRTVLEPNMTFHMICGMWRGEHSGDYNMVTSETFVVTENGFELLSDGGPALVIKD